MNRARHGFTLIELITVIGIIALLTGMGLSAGLLWQRQSRKIATRGLVTSLALAIQAYGRLTFPIGPERNERAWDANRDGLLDGGLAGEGPGTLSDWDSLVRPALAAQGYDGLPTTLHLDLPTRFVNSQGQVVDAWQRRLRITWAMRIYGDAPFAIWSAGPDGVPGGGDDIGSWPDGAKP